MAVRLHVQISELFQLLHAVPYIARTHAKLFRSRMPAENKLPWTDLNRRFPTPGQKRNELLFVTCSHQTPQPNANEFPISPN
jgi:hypothetical protein